MIQSNLHGALDCLNSSVPSALKAAMSMDQPGRVQLITCLAICQLRQSMSRTRFLNQQFHEAVISSIITMLYIVFMAWLLKQTLQQ